MSICISEMNDHSIAHLLKLKYQRKKPWNLVLADTLTVPLANGSMGPKLQPSQE
jgi:hypothetical protein